MHRRELLQKMLLGTAGLVTWGGFPRLARAAGNNTKVLFVNLNGGLDGLQAFQPNSGALYTTLSSLRPTLCAAPGALLSANSQFGFHPTLTAFKSLWDEGRLLPVLGVGYKNMTRSHLDAEVAFARGVSDRLAPTASGLLNRLGANNGWSSLRAVSVSGTDLTFEGGDYRGVQVRGLQSFYFHDVSYHQDRRQLVDTALSLSESSVLDAVKPKQREYELNYQTAIESVDMIQSAVSGFSTPMAYDNSQFGRAFQDIDTLFSTPALNTQVGYMRASGFDTHSNQQSVLQGLLSEFNTSLATFVANMKSKSLWSDMIIMVFSEFGRTNEENGSGGTDHGGANPVYLMGGVVNGGNVRGDIAVSELTDYGWLPMHINVAEVYRRVIMRMDLDPDPVVAATDGPTLEGMFS